MGSLMIRCPVTGREIQRASRPMTAFRTSPVFFSRSYCAFCRTEHEWFAKDAWVVRGAGRFVAPPSTEDRLTRALKYFPEVLVFGRKRRPRIDSAFRNAFDGRLRRSVAQPATRRGLVQLGRVAPHLQADENLDVAGIDARPRGRHAALAKRERELRPFLVQFLARAFLIRQALSQ